MNETERAGCCGHTGYGCSCGPACRCGCPGCPACTNLGPAPAAPTRATLLLREAMGR